MTTRTEDPRLPGIDFWGIPTELVMRLLREAGGDDFILEQWINDFVASGQITSEQASKLFDHIIHSWGLSKTVGLPVGATAGEIYRQVQSRGLQISPEDQAWLTQNLEMERTQTRIEAIAREPEERLGLREKFQRALRFQEKYRTFVAGELGFDPANLTKKDLFDIEAFEPDRQDQLAGLLQARAGQVGAFERAARGRSEERITRILDLDTGARAAAESAIRERIGPGDFVIPEEELRTEVWEQAGRPGFKREREEPDPEPVKPFTPPRFEGVTGAPSWQRWFERKYAGIVQRFQEREPLERTEQAFGTFLEKRTKIEREQWWRQGSFLRGERPQVFAPPIKSVRFQ